MYKRIAWLIMTRTRVLGELKTQSATALHGSRLAASFELMSRSVYPPCHCGVILII